MKKNMGTADKVIRILVAVVIGVLYFTNIISGTLAIILGVLAAVFIPSFISFFVRCTCHLVSVLLERK
jgi:fatty-acid desaturase